MAASMDIAKSAESVKLLFKSFNLLIEPSNFKQSTLNDTSEELLDCVIENNLAAFQQFLAKSQELQDVLGSYSVSLLGDIKKSFLNGNVVPVRQRFTEVCICLLHCISSIFTKAIYTVDKSTTTNLSDSSTTNEGSNKTEQVVPELPPDAMSIQQEKTIGAVLQFVVVLGVCPYLVPGVGIPVSQRLGPGQILLATMHDYGTELNDLNRIQNLVPAIKLFFCMLGVPSLSDIILNNHLSDLLAALLQVRYCAKVIMQRTNVPKPDVTAINQNTSYCLNNVPYERVLQQQIKPPHQSHLQNQNVPTDIPLQSKISECNNTQVYLHDELPEMYLDSLGQPWTLQSLTTFCSIEIDRIIRSSTVPHVLTELMLLSGGTKSRDGSRPVIPKWFRRTVAGILRDVIMVPPGVQHLITLFVGDHSSTNVSAQDWQKYKAVAQIISRCPVSPNNIKQFYTSVSRQLIELLQANETKVSHHVIRAVGAAVQELTNQQPELMQDVCLSHLLHPLLRLSCDADSLLLKDGQILLPEETFTQCTVCLHRLFVIGQEPQSSLLSKLHKVSRILVSVYFLARNSVSLIKSLSADLIKAYLGYCETAEAARFLMSLVLTGKDVVQECPAIGSTVVLESGPDGGLQAVFMKEKQLGIDSWTQPTETVMDILSGLNSDSINSQLFLCLLQKLTDIVTCEFANIEIILPARALSSTQQENKMTELREKISLVSLLASMGEKFGTQIIQSAHHILIFVKATLERCVKICQFIHDEITVSFEWETVSMALGLLTAVLSGALELSDADKKMLDELLPLLTAISECDVADPAVKEMADDLKVAVVTRGLVWAEISQMRSKRREQNKKPQIVKTDDVKPTKPLIQVLSETCITEHQVETTVVNEVTNTRKSSEKNDNTSSVAARGDKFEQALQDLCDPLLPVRGHGLISLARMVEDRDAEVKDKQEVLLKIFMENLTHADSYIYLAAVNGLAALSDLCPDQVIPCLTAEFRSKCSKSSSAKSGDIALKVGESVMKATHRLGELAPKFRDVLLPVILCGCCHEDALVRASSLSGLADICKLLRFSIGPVLHEVITCCRDVIKSDPDPEPRKAAILTITLLLRGLGKDILMALSDVLLDIYRVLKHSFNSDLDDKVKFNANLALGELDEIMREALFTKPEFKKTITILGYQ